MSSGVASRSAAAEPLVERLDARRRDSLRGERLGGAPCGQLVQRHRAGALRLGERGGSGVETKLRGVAPQLAQLPLQLAAAGVERARTALLLVGPRLQALVLVGGSAGRGGELAVDIMR